MGRVVCTRKRLTVNCIQLTMRKYTRLALFLIAFISCSLMIIYQQKYSKLNLVFQMMNVFGSRDPNSNCTRKLSQSMKSNRVDFHTSESIFGLPTWTEVFPDVHFYSTYWLEEKSRTLAYVTNSSIVNLEKLECSFLYNDTNVLISGVIKIQLFKKRYSSLVVFVECLSLKEYKFIPSVVNFVHSNLSVSVRVESKNTFVGYFSMCVSPFPPNFNDLYMMIEFLVYHHHLGVNHFIFYDNGITSTIRKILLELSSKANIVVTLLPWNVPFGFNAAFTNKNVYFVDCVHRVFVRNYSKMIINGDINKFIVSKEARNLTMLVKDSKMFLTLFPKFYEFKFCTDYEDDIVAHTLNIKFITLLKTKLLKSVGATVSLFYSVSDLEKVIKTTEFKSWLINGFLQKRSAIPKETAVIHTYTKCNGSLAFLKSNMLNDKYMWKYKDLYFKSRLYNLAKQQNLIEAN